MKIRAACFYNSLEGRKEGMGILRLFQQLRSYHDETEIRKREEITFTSQIIPRGLSDTDGP